MKNKTIQFVGILLMVFAMFTGLQASTVTPTAEPAPPPCPLVKNDMPCQILVKIEIFSSCGGSPVICNSYNQVITPFNSVATVCSCGWCDIRVTLLAVNGAPPTPLVNAVTGTAFPGNAFSSPAACSSGNIYFNATYNEFFIQ